MKIWEKMQKSTAGQSLEAKSVEHQLKEEKNKNHTLNFQIVEKEREISRLTAELKKSQTSEKNLQSQNHALNQHCEKLKTEVDMLKSNLAYNAGELDRLVAEFKQSEAVFHSELKKSLHEFESERGSLQRKLSNLQQKNHEQNQQRNIIEKQLEEYRLKSDHISREKDAAIERITLHYNNQLHDLRNQQQQYNNTIQNLKSQIESNSNLIRKQKLEYKKQIIDLESKLNKNQKIIAEANRKYEQEKQTLEYHKNEQISSLQQTKQNLESEISKQQNSNSRSQQEIDKLKAQLVKNQRDIQKIQSEFEANARAREMQFKKTISAADCRIKELEIHRQQTAVQQIPAKTIQESKEYKTQKEKIEEKKRIIKQRIKSNLVKLSSVTATQSETPVVVENSSKNKKSEIFLPGFDPKTYLSLNPDLKMNLTEATNHYINYGKEGRLISKNKLYLNQIYYQQSQFNDIIPGFYPYFNQHCSLFFESKILCDVYNQKKYHDSDYVGVFSWKLQQKYKRQIKYQDIDLNMSKYKGNYDILSFDPRQSTIPGLRRPHKGSQLYSEMSWDALMLLIQKLKQQGHIQESIPNLDKKMLRIYCNYFVTTKEIFEDYISSFMIPAINLLVNDDELYDISMDNSLYGDPPHSFIEQTQLDYYPKAPFILERLINCYTLIRGLKVGFVL